MCTNTQRASVAPKRWPTGRIRLRGQRVKGGGQGVLFHYRNMVYAIFVVLHTRVCRPSRVAVISTPSSAPLIAATRLRHGSTNSARGTGKLLADTLAAAR